MGPKRTNGFVVGVGPKWTKVDYPTGCQAENASRDSLVLLVQAQWARNGHTDLYSEQAQSGLPRSFPQDARKKWTTSVLPTGCQEENASRDSLLLLVQVQWARKTSDLWSGCELTTLSLV
jgi:hypothetical protein